jgi:hypothetical protein
MYAMVKRIARMGKYYKALVKVSRRRYYCDGYRELWCAGVNVIHCELL